MFHTARSPHTCRCSIFDQHRSDEKGAAPAAMVDRMRPGYVDDLVAEIARLQGLIHEYAHARHWMAGPVTGGRCRCEGCELLGDLATTGGAR